MERDGFNLAPHETSAENTDDSTEKGKKKKKKSPESAPADQKKDSVAERGKSLWEKLVGDDKAETKVESKPDKTPVAKGETDQAAPETQTEPDLETLTDGERQEVIRAYAQARLGELENGRSELETPVDMAAREANIELLQGMLSELVGDAELGPGPDADSDADLDIEPNLAEQQPTNLELPADEANDFEPDQPVRLTSRQSSRTRPAASTPPTGQPPSPPPPQIPRPTASGSGRRPPIGSSAVPDGAANLPATPNLAPTGSGEYQPDYRQNPNVAYLLVGGIVGYLVGRRRGRIKTEKRLASVQRKLEKQVESVQQQVVQKEVEVQQLAREQHRQLAAIAEKSPHRRNTTSHPEAVHRPITPAELSPLSTKQLLAKSETIKVGATDLRRVFEAKLINESGLRRLVADYEAGHDIRRGLAREFLAKELSYERDPHFRDLRPLGETASRSVAKSDPLSLLPTATAADQSTAAKSTVPARSSRTLRLRRASQHTVSTGLLVVLTLLALGLAAFAVLLSATR